MCTRSMRIYNIVIIHVTPNLIFFLHYNNNEESNINISNMITHEK